jgi:3-methyladenine DNA glycosylase AlkD
MATSKPKQLIDALKAIADRNAVDKVARFFWPDPNAHSSDNKMLGVSIGKIFPIAKQFVEMSLKDIERLLDNPYYEVRVGAVSIMDFQARNKKIAPEERKALYDLYLRRHDRINNWDLVDRAAPYVVGGYLADKSRAVLYKLARSRNPWERRTAIVSTYYFIRLGDVNDTFGVAEILAQDKHELVQKAVGSWIREAGKKDQKQLVNFLGKHARSMPRTMLRYAVEKLPPAQRAKFLEKS